VPAVFVVRLILAYKPIESYGVIGDMHSVALVAYDGSIDWCCLPEFDSPSVFAAILDERKGGYFKIASTRRAALKQMYLPETNVLVTRFLSRDGVGEVTDFMPVRHQQEGQDEARWHQIVRVAQAVRGRVSFRLECYPAYDFARQKHKLTVNQRGAIFELPEVRFGLISARRLTKKGNGVVANFTLEQGESATFIFRYDDHDCGEAFLEPLLDGGAALRHTVEYWRRWLAHGQYEGRWREMVDRSALLLKLLTFEPTGAIVASPTCSLPEEIGGVRNWDYRYTWIRDAAFTTYAFIRLGYTEEAANFMHWLQERVRGEDSSTGPLQTMYTIHGGLELPEENLEHLDGYRHSRPVRVGNAAADQLQLDIYGELIDSIYLYDKYATPIPYDLWGQIRRMLDWVARNWKNPDEGIWEVRGGRQQFVYSKMQCWVALDRGLRLATKRSLPIAPRLRQERDRIYEAIMKKGWDAKRRTFVQYFGSDALDASNLLMPLVLFLSPTDPRMTGTINRTMQELVSDSLVHRYEIGKGAGDGLTGREGTFSMCTFWLVEALSRARRLDEARLIFEKMLTYANHLGLYAEQIGPSGEALGNFPQAFTHLGLISAAFSLDRQLKKR
jgi:GH15 family glucan-1,4-alpha-glucosidase